MLRTRMLTHDMLTILDQGTNMQIFAYQQKTQSTNEANENVISSAGILSSTKLWDKLKF